MEVYLEQIILTNYRNFSRLELNINNNIIIISGENGSGKTNILEAISLLSPGRGIRGAKYEDIIRLFQQTEQQWSSNLYQEWSSNLYLQSKLGKALVHSNYSKKNNSRILEYNGSKISNSELTNLVNIIWITPQMDGVFLGSSSDKRKYLDRIVYNFYPEHAANVNQYNYLCSERLKVLSVNGGSSNDEWILILEKKIAEIALKINNLRSNTVDFLQDAIKSIDTLFPKAEIKVTHLFKDAVAEDVFLEKYLLELYKSRQKDKITKRTNFGINKQEFIVIHQEKNQPANLCSTGEQKALLISILLAQIEASKKVTRTNPILLLDELFVHLDDKRKDYLAENLINSKLQTFVTTTSLDGLEKIVKNAQLLSI